MRAVAALLFCCAAPALLAAEPARQIDASYDVSTRGIKIAEITEKFVRTGNHYRIESATRPVGLLAVFKPDTIDVSSEGEVTAQGLRPQKYTYKRTLDTEKNAEATFDWAQSRLMLNDRQGRRPVSLPSDTQDRLSVLYQFRYVPLLKERKELTIHITDGSKVDARRYLIRPAQKLTIPLGTLETVYLSTVPEATAWKTEVWLAVDKGDLPCKIILTEDNGNQLTQVLTALSITP
jgi:hypothetical protein